MLSKEGTKIQLQETKTFLGMDEQGELAITGGETFTMEFTLCNYMHNLSTFINQPDTKKGFAEFIDILYHQKKLPWSQGVKILYKFGLLLLSYNFHFSCHRTKTCWLQHSLWSYISRWLFL